MKKIFLVLVLLFILSSCNTESRNDKKLNLPVGGFVSFSVDDTTYKAQIISVENSNLNLKFVQPKELCGINAAVSSNGISIKYDDLSIDYNTDSITPQLTVLSNAFNNLFFADNKNSDVKIKTDDNGNLLNLSSGNVLFNFERG